MSIKSAPYYWVECDNCGVRCEYGEFSAMDSSGDAVAYAIDSEWSKQGERHHCPDCPVISDCEDAGAGPGERDYHCQACWDATGDVTFTFPGGSEVTVDRAGNVLGKEPAS